MINTKAPLSRKAIYPALCMAAHLGLAPLAASAQSVLVTTGEHGEFTRLVLQSTQAIEWSLDEQTGTRRTLRLPSSALELDLSRAFQRIGRNRLAGLARDRDALVLELACDCSIRAWQERPGLVVLDIHDAGAAGETPVALAQEGPAAQSLSALPAYPVDPAPLDLSTETTFARNAGTALARDWAEQQAAQAATAQPDDISLEAQLEIARQLARQVAGAMGQGLLEPAARLNRGADMVLPGGDNAGGDAPSNLRISSVLDRPDMQSVQLSEASAESCTQTHTLETLLVAPGEPFNTSYSRLMRSWIGEFDIPDTEHTLALAELYLQHGFGAEARAILENSTAPVPGRDLLLGFSDILEGRHSNSRLRLAEQLTCGGITTMLAALAGAPPAQIRARATEVAIAFAQTPSTLRAILGQDLVALLIDVGATEAARVVADTLRRTADIIMPDMALIDAMLDRARGDTDMAAERLDHSRRDNVETLKTRLDLALERRETLAPAMLENAEALAASIRSTAAGAELMAATIRLNVIAGSSERALESLDRMRQWPDALPARRALEAELSDTVWHALADQLDDNAFLTTIMARSDWRRPGHSAATRTALAGRMLDFGLGDLAAPLLEPSQGEAMNRQLARLHLLRNDPQAALDTLGEDISEPAQSLRADALHAIGASTRASALLAEAGSLDAARRMATTSADWATLEDLGLRSGEDGQRALARALASTPGQFRTAPAGDPGLNAQPAVATRADVGTAQEPTAEPTLASADPLAPGMLQRGALLLSESEALRDTLGRLLEPQHP